MLNFETFITHKDTKVCFNTDTNHFKLTMEKKRLNIITWVKNLSMGSEHPDAV